MHADSCFRMGATHAICQDYAAAGERNGVVYAVVSDGCSGSPTGEPGSPFTDYGARFLTRAAQRFTGLVANQSTELHPLVISTADSMRRSAGLPCEALDATLIIAEAFGTVCTVHQTGDGVVAARRRTGEIDFYWSEFDQNMPLYLSYLLDTHRRDECLRQSGWVTLHSAIASGEQASERVRLHEHSFGRDFVFHARFHDLVLILSDGAESFHERDGTPVPLDQVLEQLFAIKGFAGQFLARRCGRFLGSFCAERGWKHADDFSVAGIYLGATP